jgi:hypothetical protein
MNIRVMLFLNKQKLPAKHKQFNRVKKLRWALKKNKKFQILMFSHKINRYSGLIIIQLIFKRLHNKNNSHKLKDRF